MALLSEKELMEPANTPLENRPEQEPTGPVALPSFEYNLLTLAKFVVGEIPADQARKLIDNKISTPPPCVSGQCVRIAQDIIGKGVMLRLVRAGGWRRERFLRKNEPVIGRIWERIPLNERTLDFSAGPLAFLFWLTQERPTDRTEFVSAIRAETAADEVFFMLALDALAPLKENYLAIANLPAFRNNPLCWLTHPVAVSGTPNAQVASFEKSFTGTRLAVLECLQAELTKRWIRTEREKSLQTNWIAMRQQGAAEQLVLTAYLEAVNKADRWDLARFVLNSNSTIILGQPNPAPSFWLGNLRTSPPPRLADRLETQRLALALTRQMETLRQWNQRAKTVGHFDEGYTAKQLWKADWEAAQGDLVAVHAHTILERLEPLRAS